MDLENRFQPLVFNFLTKSGTAEQMLSIGKGYPIIPVEHVNTCHGLRFNS